MRIARQFTAGSDPLLHKSRRDGSNLSDAFKFAPVPIDVRVGVIQPSLRGWRFLFHTPTLERVGYFQISLREMANKWLFQWTVEEYPNFWPA